MKRKKYLILAAGLILAFLFCLGANAGQILTSLSSEVPVNISLVENNQAIVKAETYEGLPGDEIKVPITIQNANGTAGAQFDILYDPGVAVATAVEKGELVEDFILVSNLADATNGKISIALAGSTGVTGDGTLVVVTLKLGDKEGETDLDLENVELNDENGDIIPSKVIIGKIIIKAAPPPVVKETEPVGDTDNVALDTKVKAVFDQEVEEVDLKGVTIKDTVYGDPVSGLKATLDADQKTLNIEHDTFNYLTGYTVTIPAKSVRSVTYKTYNEEYKWNFTTAQPPKPEVKSTMPTDGAGGVPLNTELSATFDQDISVVQAAYIKINDKPVGADNVTATGNKLTIKHDDFALNTSYTVEIGAESVQSVAYKTYNEEYKWNFTTRASGGGGGGGGGVSPSCLEVESQTPAKDASMIDLDTEVSVVFKKEIEAVNDADLERITIEDANGNAVLGIKATVKDKKLNIEHDKFVNKTKYTVTIPEKCVKDKASNLYNCKIEWSFTTKEELIPRCEFKDLTKEHWAYECIMKLCQEDIVEGYPDKTFRPGKNITRAEFTKLLVVALGLARENPATPTFRDVPSSLWSYGYVEAAAKKGLIKGYQGEFRPEDFITREEIIAIMVRALGKENEAKAKATDKIAVADSNQISSWAKGYVALAVSEGLIEGYPDKTLKPKNKTTRAEAATLICRFKEKK